MIKKLFQCLLFAVIASASFSAGAQSKKLSPTSIPGAESHVYKSVGDTTNLLLHVFRPSQPEGRKLRAAMIFFFGGGWSTGSVNQFVPHATYFADHGMVTVLADYRVKTRHGVTPFDCVADAHDAMRWLRAHASEFGIDPQLIAAAGGSAGGHLAATTALLDGFGLVDETPDVSVMPNALVLFNPVLDVVELAQRRASRASDWPGKPETISPLHHMHKDVPPTIIFHGTDDKTVPFTQVTRFRDAMKEHGNACEVVPFEGRGHGFFNHGKGDNSDYRTTLQKTEKFLVLHGFLQKS